MRLVVRREPDRSFSLLGVLLDESRDRKLTIRTVTGSTETVPRNAQIIMMVRGSIPHFAAMHRDRLQEAAVRAPVALYEQVLIDAVPKSMTATALKEKVLNAGVSADEADQAWIAASEQFKSSDDVAIKGSGKAVKYSWAGTDPSSRLEGFLPADYAALTVDSVGFTEGGDAVESEGAHAVSVDEHSADGPVDPLIAMLNELLGERVVASRAAIGLSVLRLGDALSTVSGEQFRQLYEVEDPKHGIVQFLAFARRDELDRSALPDRPVDPSIASSVLSAAVDEASRSSEADRRFPLFASRVLDHVDVDRIPLSVVAKVFIRAAATVRDSGETQHLLRLGDALARSVQQSYEDSWGDADSLIRDVARGMSLLPLDADGPRSRFLVGIYNTGPAHLEDDLFWRGVDVESLDSAYHGILRHVLNDPGIANRIIGPIVFGLLKRVRSRQDLGKVMALRSPLVAHINGTALMSAFERVAEHDRKAQEWLNAVAQDKRITELIAARDEALALAERARAAADEAERRRASALGEVESARAALQQNRQANQSAFSASLRQAKLDVLKSLLNLASFVYASSVSDQDPGLLQRVEFALRREGLVPTARSGDQALYDPSIHDAEGAHIDPGTSVTVRGPGYKYRGDGEDIILVKAPVQVA